MDNWKELEVDNLPPDILTGDYEWQEKYNIPPYWRKTKLSGKHVLKEAIDKDAFDCFHYRRKQKPAPTHEEIMTKWWKRPCGVSWFRVIVYAPRTHDYYRPNPDGDDGWHTKKEFTNFESADIPPEE